MAAKWQKIDIPVSAEYSDEEKRAIAKEIIDRIVERTQSGKDKDGKSFQKYSKEYAQLKRAITGSSSPVDLTLMGDMLNDLSQLEVPKSIGNKIRIGYDRSDKKMNGKVEGNRLGTYGQDSPVTKGRDFLGISEKELRSILSKYPLEDDKRAASRTRAFVSDLTEQLSRANVTDFESMFGDQDEDG